MSQDYLVLVKEIQSCILKIWQVLGLSPGTIAATDYVKTFIFIPRPAEGIPNNHLLDQEEHF